MDTDSVGTQYIICECGDNFPNEKLLNIHLANGHEELETFQCDSCPEIFTNEELFQKHSNEHDSQREEEEAAYDENDYTDAVDEEALDEAAELSEYDVNTSEPASHDAEELPVRIVNTYSETALEDVVDEPIAEIPQETPMIKRKPLPKTLEMKTYSRNKPTRTVPKPPKAPPLIKLNNLKRIDSISLIQNLKDYGNLVKIHSSLLPEETPPQNVVETVKEEQLMVKSEMEIEDVNEEIYYQCDVCNTIFYTEQEFDVHYRSTHAIKMEVTAEAILEEHLVSDHIDDANVKAEMQTVETVYYFECEMCHKIFASEEYFNIHYNKVHGGLMTSEVTEQEQALAEQTEDYSVQEHEAKESKATKAPEQVVYYKCDLCKILFPSEKSYTSHFNKKHADAKTAGFRFIEQDLAGDYARAPPPPDAQEFCCESCPKKFGLKRSLQMHRKRVHDENPMGRKPAPPGSRAPSRSKVCDICGRAYNSNAALRYHQRRHTGEKPYPCTMCPKRFTMPMFLQIHLRTHTGEKPYECQQCPKAFTNKAALIRHDRVHTGIKPYPCPECGKFFTQSNSMKLHVSTVHLKLPAPYKSKNRRQKSEVRALQLALKTMPTEIIEEDIIDETMEHDDDDD